MKWRKWNNIIHRDLGYLCVGLTVVYAVSGVAVNHIADWNPSFAIESRTISVDDALARAVGAPEGVRSVLEAVGLPPVFRATFRPDANRVRIFVEDGVVDIDLAAAEATVEVVRARPILREANFLHLNHAKRLWTWLADLYAVALGLLAVTGLFVLKGKKGITGRGAWLAGIGLAVPLLFLWLYL
jgi:hypothetical protein